MKKQKEHNSDSNQKPKPREVDLKNTNTNNKPTYTTISNIVEGYSNLIKGSKKELKNKRLSICKECPYLNIHTTSCSVCGCYLPAKASVPDEACPKGKWDSEYNTTSNSNK